MSVFDKFSLKGKVALVTGAKRGIGKAIALTLAEAGAHVAVCDLPIEEEELQKVAAEIGKMGQRSLAVFTDVSHHAQVENMVMRVNRELGPVDILVNNSGINTTSIPNDPPSSNGKRF